MERFKKRFLADVLESTLEAEALGLELLFTFKMYILFVIKKPRFLGPLLINIYFLSPTQPVIIKIPAVVP